MNIRIPEWLLPLVLMVAIPATIPAISQGQEVVTLPATSVPPRFVLEEAQIVGTLISAQEVRLVEPTEVPPRERLGVAEVLATIAAIVVVIVAVLFFLSPLLTLLAKGVSKDSFRGLHRFFVRVLEGRKGGAW